jgi:hypothetical protein
MISSSKYFVFFAQTLAISVEQRVQLKKDIKLVYMFASSTRERKNLKSSLKYHFELFNRLKMQKN